MGQDVQLGPELETLKSFSLALDPTSRGWAVSNSEKIREGELGIVYINRHPLTTDK